MRVNDLYRKLNDAVTTGTGAAKPATPEKPADATSGKPTVGEAVHVSVSDEARELARTKNAESERIEKLRAAVQGGTYQVDPQKVAAKIVEDEG